MFFDGIVESQIVHDGDNGYKAVANELYRKYIRVGSEWEINIDYGNRNWYRALFENDKLMDNTQELYSIFDPCIDIMIGLTFYVDPVLCFFRSDVSDFTCADQY